MQETQGVGESLNTGSCHHLRKEHGELLGNVNPLVEKLCTERH